MRVRRRERRVVERCREGRKGGRRRKEGRREVEEGRREVER